MEKLLDLNEEQKDFVLKNWDKVSFGELVKLVFNNPDLDGRSIEGRSIKAFLGTKRPKTSAWEKKDFSLTEEQKEFIKNNLELRPIDLARTLLNNPRIEPLSKPVLVIRKYKESLGPIYVTESEDLPEEDYKPPTHLPQVVKKINDYCQKDWKLEELPQVRKKAVEALRGFLHSPRFIQMINAYVSKKSRQIFESEFVRSTYDKPDLTADELNLYVNLCSNFVLMITIQRHLDLLNERFELDVENTEKNVSQSLSEMIKTKTDELNKCDKRQSDLINDLNGKRSSRIKDQRGNSANIANLLAWWKDEEERKKALHWAEIRRQDMETEISRLESIDEMKARILGISKSELLNG